MANTGGGVRVRRRTGNTGGEHGEKALPLQVEQMLLLHLKKLLLDGDLLCGKLGHKRPDLFKATNSNALANRYGS